LHGASNCRAFTSGYKFRLEEFYRDDMNNTEYVLTGIRHEGSQSYPTGDTKAEQIYKNEFTCIPIDVPFRPQRVTRKPLIEGVQTAIVVGPSGEEIYPDKYGRVKVQFHWDREGQNNESSSCWVRVSQVWAGAGWGAMFIPRIGHEVIVDFLEGDPDRPIITGRVYHGNNNPPYSLPAEKTKSTIKSNSSQGGGGFNEFRFEDKKGSEEIYLHGQKDWNIMIVNNKGQTIGVNDQLLVGNNQSIIIGVNRTESVGQNESITIGASKTETVAINKAESIGVAKELTIGGAYQVTVGAAMNETVGGSKMVDVGAYATEKVGGNKTENIGGKKDFSTGKDYSIAVGKSLGIAVKDKGSISVEKDFEIGTEKVLTVKAKESILIQSDKDITLKAGSAQITLKKNGDIEIKGNKINVKGSGDVKIKGSKVGIN
jgi:type VI secretion system secreted protein VgrG